MQTEVFGRLARVEPFIPLVMRIAAEPSEDGSGKTICEAIEQHVDNRQLVGAEEPVYAPAYRR